jgi:hypothetical protein
MNLDHESMKGILISVTEFDQAQCNNKQYMSIRFSTKTSYVFGRTVTYQRETLHRVFSFFKKNKIPKCSNMEKQRLCYQTTSQASVA